MEKNAGSFDGLFLRLMMGGAIGILAGLKFAPKAGEEVRADIKEKGCEGYGDDKEMISDTQTEAKSIKQEKTNKKRFVDLTDLF